MRIKISLFLLAALALSAGIAAAQESIGFSPVRRTGAMLGKLQEIPFMVVTPPTVAGVDRAARCWAPSFTSTPVPCRFLGTHAPTMGEHGKASRFDLGDNGMLRIYRWRPLKDEKRKLKLHTELFARYIPQILAYGTRGDPDGMREALGEEGMASAQTWSLDVYEAAGGECRACPPAPPQPHFDPPDSELRECRALLRSARDSIKPLDELSTHIARSEGGVGHHNEVVPFQALTRVGWEIDFFLEGR